MPFLDNAQSHSLLLLAGLAPSDRPIFVEVLREHTLGCTCVGVDSLSEAFDVLETFERRSSNQGDTNIIVIAVGPEAVTAGWEATAAALRRAAPSAALIAIPKTNLLQSEANAASWFDSESELFHDVLSPTEREPRLLVKSLRCGLVIARAQVHMARWAMRDPLTDVLNRRGLERVLRRESGDGLRRGGSLSALLVDCDDFKRVNDLFGLAMGDDVLRMVAEVLTRSVRARDTVARVGGDEFLVLLPDTRLQSAVEVAERIRREIRATLLLPDGDCLTVSIGVRRIEGHSGLREVVEATGDGLQQSKREGKDQVRVVDHQRGESVSAASPASHSPLVCHIARDLASGVALLDMIEVAGLRSDAETLSPVQIAILRASDPDIDGAWFRVGVDGLSSDRPSHVRIYPRTLANIPPATLLGWLPAHVVPSRVVLSLDDQALSGDPSHLVSHVAQLRESGLQLALESADIGRSCLETLILLRPERIILAPALVRGVGHSRILTSELSRLVRACVALCVDVVAGEVISESDRVALLQIGIHIGILSKDFPG